MIFFPFSFIHLFDMFYFQFSTRKRKSFSTPPTPLPPPTVGKISVECAIKTSFVKVVAINIFITN